MCYGFLIVFSLRHHGTSFTLMMKHIIIVMVMRRWVLLNAFGDAFEGLRLFFANLFAAHFQKEFSRGVSLLHDHIVYDILFILLQLDHSEDHIYAVLIIIAII